MLDVPVVTTETVAGHPLPQSAGSGSKVSGSQTNGMSAWV
jgi:hypothetical protein